MVRALCYIGDFPDSECSEGFEWGNLPADSLVVDVGGGIGTVTMNLAEKHKHLRYVVQDLPGVVAESKEVRPPPLYRLDFVTLSRTVLGIAQTEQT